MQFQLYFGGFGIMYCKHKLQMTSKIPRVIFTIVFMALLHSSAQIHFIALI